MRRLLPSTSLLLLSLAPACFDPDPPAITSDTDPDTGTTDPSATADDTAGDACRDGAMNGDETDVDCGGSCEPCSTGQSCGDGTDCASLYCDAGTCVDPGCQDGTMNGVETDVDCGGPACDHCGDGQSCNQGADCTSGVCSDGTCQAPTCGDAVVNAAGEECDDGVDSAECDVDCTEPACGDGSVNMAAGELCDDMVETEACDADCTVVECGDGQPNAAAGELCDDGEGSATCDADCTEPACGDAIVNEFAGETCDDGVETAACDADCTASECGDAVVNTLADEQCDDGDGIDDNLCNNACAFNTCVFDTTLLPVTVHPNNFFGDFDFDGSCNLLVSGGFDTNGLLRVDASTGGVSSLVMAFAGSSSVNGVAHRASDGLTYVATDLSPQLWSVTDAGVLDLIMPLPAIINAIVVAPPGFGAYGDLIIGAGYDGNVYALDPDSGSFAVVGGVGTGLSDLAFDISTGLLYLALYDMGQVMTMTSGGATAMVVGGVLGIDGVAVDPAGTLYYASSNNNSITAFDLDSGGQMVVANPTLDGGYYVTGLLVDGEGTLLMKVGNAEFGADIAFYSP